MWQHFESICLPVENKRKKIIGGFFFNALCFSLSVLSPPTTHRGDRGGYLRDKMPQASGCSNEGHVTAAWWHERFSRSQVVVKVGVIQSVLNAAAKLIARLPRFTNFHLHDWSFTLAPVWFCYWIQGPPPCIQISTFPCPSYLIDFMSNVSSTSARPLRSADRLDLFVPRARTALSQCSAFAVTGSFIGVNPGMLGSRPPQILGRGSWGVAGRVAGGVVKYYYILSCTWCMLESGDFWREIE